ncbi:hypothetical protein DA01_08760 [Dehalococcoides mccartyi]|uniref:Uncharacterized protein n=2 Tax=Dehalococcoides mccartyi TaxID=61435 RepID=A0A0V8LXA4_9CHLR|nr:hypothetical protein DA01_08760 [Dehalococcoides mccartyi]
MSTVLLIVGIAVALLFFPMVLSSMDSIRFTENTGTYATVTTGVGETSADVVLSAALFNDDTTHVTSITSTVETDVPVAGTYTTGTKTLTITGLTASESRTLTVIYDSDGLTDYTGLGIIVGLSPLIIWLVILGALGVGLYTNVRS